MSDCTSKSISYLRFPLAFMIVWLHYYTPDIDATHYQNCDVYGIIGIGYQALCTFVVPLFFFISGFLYFNRIKVHGGQFNKSTYLKKTRKRIKSLLIPYLLWNLIVLVFYSCVQLLSHNSPEMQKAGYKLISDYTLIDFAKVFWAIDSTGMPIDGPLWFIRDLFVTSLFTPIIYLFLKYTKIFGVFLLFVGFAIGLDTGIKGLSYGCIFYFSLGASAQLLYKGDFLDMLSRIAPQIAICGIVVLACLQFYNANQSISILGGYIGKVYILGMIIFVWSALRCRYVKSGLNIYEILPLSSFFIFAIHKPIQVIIRRMTFAVLNPSNEIILISLIFIIPCVVVAVSLGIFYVIRKYFPWLRCLNGFRI